MQRLQFCFNFACDFKLRRYGMAGLAGGADRTLVLWAACTLVAAAAASVG
jgi:hypothetical protein